MNERMQRSLGVPHITLAGFQLWVHGQAYADAADGWDQQWLRVTAHAGAADANVWASGTLLESASVVRFRNELVSLHNLLVGEAVLESHEPNIFVRVTAVGQSGHLAMRAELSPNHITQGHWFRTRSTNRTFRG
jgi:hypothetical protein